MEIVTFNEGDSCALYEARDIDNRLQRLSKQVEAVGDFLLKHCEDEGVKVFFHDKLNTIEDEMNTLVCGCLSYGVNTD